MSNTRSTTPKKKKKKLPRERRDRDTKDIARAPEVTKPVPLRETTVTVSVPAKPRG